MTFVKTSKNEESLVPVRSDFFDADRFFSNRRFLHEQDLFMPAVNIQENPKGFRIELAAPGFSKKDFKISIEDTSLIISAEKETEKIASSDRFTRREFSSTSFSRTFNLPQNTDEDQIDAAYVHGILQLNIAKKEKDKPFSKKHIQIS
jgi:HSP20 family protein